MGYGVAYLHEGLSEAETKIVEQLFNSGAIQVIDTLIQEFVFLNLTQNHLAMKCAQLLRYYL